ncbi:MAG TPA: Ig-like domain-containing protein, partial [Anaerolineales bacterium]|nr:Ig-like domain-containing protein [Anaerolineales bacterium]
MAQEPRHPLGRVRLSAILLAVALLAVSAVFILPRVWPRPSPDGATPTPDKPLTTAEGGVAVDEGEPRLDIQLGPGQAQLQTPQPVPTAAGVPLSDEEVQRIFARLPSLTLAPEDRLEFRLPAESLPPPRTGETIQEPFPPLPVPTAPPLVEAGPLEVLRFAPEGEIPLAPFVNVTFNQPMAPLTTLAQLAAQDVPVTLEPAVPGAWRWVGTKTLVFEADSAEIDRLPKATEYHVTVPAGTRSMVGGVLAGTVSWSFTTP